MSFDSRLKGKITQGLFQTLLEDVKYRIVPLGIEEVIREVQAIEPAEYGKLELSTTLRRLPDFFIALPDLSKSWLVEVKYRKGWNDWTRDQLGEQIFEQVKQWAPLYVVVFVGEAARATNTPASNLGVFKAVVQDGQLGIIRKILNGDPPSDPRRGTEKFVPWKDVTWSHILRFQDVFSDVSERWEDQTLIKAIKVMKGLD
jgi:hypothetical protein